MICFKNTQIGSEWHTKRLVYATVDTGESADDADKRPVLSSVDPSQETDIHKAATRHEVEKLLTASGDNQSSEQIAWRIKEIKDLRDAGNFSELQRKIIAWYGSHPTYSSFLALSGNKATPAVINRIRDEEIQQLRNQLQREAQLEMDELMAKQTPPSYRFALSHLTMGTHGGVKRLATETKALLNELHLNAPNSATEYLELTHQREELQNRLDIAQAELHQQKGKLAAHNTEKTLFEEEIPRFSKKIKKWLKIGGLVSLPLGLITGGTGAGIAALAGSKAIGTVAAIAGATPLGAVLGGGILGKIGQKINDARRAITHWWTAWGHERAIEHAEESSVTRERRRALMNAEERLQHLREENAGKLAVLNRQYQDYVQARTDAGTEAEREQIEQKMQSLASLMTLYRVSEGDYAKRITSTGTVTNAFIVERLQALGVSGVDDDSDALASLVQLSKKDDENHIRAHQKTLQELGVSGELERELESLDNTEERSLRAFLTTPGSAPGSFVTSDFRRKAPRMVAAIDAIHSLPANNAWRESMRLAIISQLDGKAGQIARSSVMAVMSDIEELKPKMAKALRRNPELLIKHAKRENAKKRGTFTHLPLEPNAGEHLDSWTHRLSAQQLSTIAQILEKVQSLSLNDSGHFVDELGPVREGNKKAFDALSPEFQTLFDTNAKAFFKQAAEKMNDRTDLIEKMPDTDGSKPFKQLITEISDPLVLSSLRQMLIKIKRDAFVRNDAICLYKDDMDAVYNRLKELKDDDVAPLVRSHPEVLDVLVSQTVPPMSATHPVSHTFDEYLRNITPEQRQTVIDAIPKISDPSNRFVLNAAKNGLEKEVDQLREKIMSAFVLLEDAAKVRLNTPNVSDVRNTLQSATKPVFNQNRTLSLPDGPGYTFKDRVEKLKNIDQLKLLAELMEGIVSGCEYVAGSYSFRKKRD